MISQHIIDTLFTASARTEEQLHPHSVVLPGFPRSIQLDGYSCGAKSTYMILRYFDCRCTAASVEQCLRTTADGTSSSDIKRVLREHALKTVVHIRMNLQGLKSAIDAGSPVLVSLYHGEHYSVVYGYSPGYIFVMNPSLGKMGSLKCAVGLAQWRGMFDGWGIIIKRPQ
jgi:ABC-type bacteriocin/lantibiotic exporter with double-glycine peptidase domain